MKKFLGSILRVMRMCYFRAQNDPFEKKYFDTDYYYYFHLPIVPFHCAKLKKKLLQQIQSCEDAPFLGPKWSICLKQNFFSENIDIILICLLAPCHSCPVGIFPKKSGSVTHNYIWAPNTMLNFRKN